MDRREYVPHAVTAMLHLAGPQPTNITVQHPGTDEATVAVTLPDCLMYLRTRGAAEAIGQTWRRAAVEALALPRGAGAFQPPHRPNAAEPSVVVHTHGRPPGFARLNREPGTTAYLHVQIGGLTFFLHDNDAFESVAGAFLRAAELGARHLSRVDLRQALINRPRRPNLDGQAAPGAREHLEQIARHPAHVAEASLAQLENRLATVVDPLQAALARVRALRQTDRRTARAQQDAREQPPTDRGIPAARAPAPEQHASPIHRRPGRKGGPPLGEQRRGGRTR